jgi:type VII secretion protein EccB
LGDNQLASARPMSRALFDAIPVGPALTVPTVPQAGSPAGFAGAPGPVGTVVSTGQVGGQVTYSVVLPDGMQTVTAVAAQILTNAGPATAKMPVLAGSALAKLPTAGGLDVSVYPDTPPHILDGQMYSAACWHWAKVSGESLAAADVIAGPTIPTADSQTDKIVDLVKADKSGWQADRVYFGPQYANYLIATGDTASSPVAHPLWWVSESGVRFGVDRDEETLRALGLSTTPSPAPWSVLRLLAPGPALSRADALTRHNTLPTDSSPGELETPK